MIQSKGVIRIDKDFDHYQTSLQTPSEESWRDKSTNKVSNMLSMHSQNPMPQCWKNQDALRWSECFQAMHFIIVSRTHELPNHTKSQHVC